VGELRYLLELSTRLAFASRHMTRAGVRVKA